MSECKICGRAKSTFEQYDPHDCNPRITKEQLAVYDAARNFIRLSLDPAWTSADVDQVESIKAKMAEAFNDLQSLLKDSIQAEAAASSQQTEP